LVNRKTPIPSPSRDDRPICELFPSAPIMRLMETLAPQCIWTLTAPSKLREGGVGEGCEFGYGKPLGNELFGTGQYCNISPTSGDQPCSASSTYHTNHHPVTLPSNPCPS
jgi:hypothetical protein